jgi:hypothetical protein
MIPKARVFARIDPKQFEACFLHWVQSISEEITGVIAIDGKTLRRSHDRGNGKKALHMVSASATRVGIKVKRFKAALFLCFFFELILSGYGFPTASVPGECTFNRASSQNTAEKIQQKAFVIPYASAQPLH